MKKILILLCMGLILVSCGKDQKVAEQSVTDPLPPAPEESTVDPVNNVPEAPSFQKMVSMIGKQYKEDNTFRVCMQAATDGCISETSFSSEKKVACSDFLLESNRTNCEQTKAVMKAKEALDMSLCESLDTAKDGCMYEVALAKGISDLDVSVCDQLSESYQVGCHNEIVKAKARSEKDVSVCEDMKSYNEAEGEDFEKQFCIDEVTFLIEEDERIAEQEALQAQLAEQEPVLLEQPPAEQIAPPESVPVPAPEPLNIEEANIGEIVNP